MYLLTRLDTHPGAMAWPPLRSAESMGTAGPARTHAVATCKAGLA